MPLRAIASGQLDAGIGYTRRSDEVGDMARAIQVLRDNGLALNKLETETRSAEARAHQALQAERDRFVDLFQEDVLHVIGALSTATAELQRYAAVMRDIAHSTDDRTKLVVRSSRVSVDMVQALGFAAREFSTLVDTANLDFFNANQIAAKAINDGQVNIDIGARSR